MRQPQLIRWNAYLETCIETLENSSEAAPSDKVLCHCVRLQKWTDTVAAMVHPEDDSTSTRASEDLSSKIEAIKRQIDEWQVKNDLSASTSETPFIVMISLTTQVL
jgi:hypothetical protein